MEWRVFQKLRGSIWPFAMGMIFGAIRIGCNRVVSCYRFRTGIENTKLSQNSLEEIYHSEAAELIRKMHFNQDFSNCNPNACPFVLWEIQNYINEIVDHYSFYIRAYEKTATELVLYALPN